MDALPAAAPPTPVESALARYRATGDARAFAEVFDATSAELFHVALSLLEDPAAAEDAVQETYIGALSAIARFEHGRRVMPWLVGILQNRILHARRGIARRAATFRSAAARAGAPLGNGPEELPDSDSARRAIESLEEPYRSVALLRWRYGLEPAEIAHVRGEPPGTTRSLLSRALDRLKRAIPGAFLVFGFERAPRGLDAVRGEVVRAAAAAAGAGTASIVGGILMGKKIAVAAAAVLLLLGGGLAFWAPWGKAETSDREAKKATLGAGLVAPEEKSGGAKLAAARAAPKEAKSLKPFGAVSGRVADPAGQPIAGAAIVALSEETSRALTPADLAGGVPGIARAESGADGRFRVALAEEDAATLVVTAPGRAAAVVGGVRRGQEKTIVLKAASRLVGRVTDMELKPVRGAKVRVFGLLDALRIEREAISGKDGRYRIEDLPFPDERIPGAEGAWVEVTEQEHAPLLQQLRSRVSPDEDPVERDWVLVRGARVKGHVLEAETGDPLEGARVLLLSYEGMWSPSSAGGRSLESPFSPRVIAEARSAVDGAYAFDHVPAKGWHSFDDSVPQSGSGPRLGAVLALKDGWAPVEGNELTVVADGAVIEREVKLRPAAAIEGRVVDASGAAVAKATVSIKDAALPWLPASLGEFPATHATTDAAGRFRLTAIPASAAGRTAIRLQVFAPAGNPRSSTEPDAAVEAQVKASETLALPDIVLGTEIPSTTLRVVAPDGTPIRGASVRNDDYAWGRTDAEGLFRCRWWAPTERPLPATWKLVVMADGFATATFEVPTRADGGAPFDARLAPGTVLRGSVVEADGRSAAGAEVVVWSQGEAAGYEARRGERAPVAAPLPGDSPPRQHMLGSARTDGEGRFEIDTLPPPPWNVQASSRSSIDGARSRSVTLDLAERATDVALRLPAVDAPPSGGLRGSVADEASGEPVLSFSAALWPPAAGIVGQAFQPGPSRFRFDGLPLGPARIRFEARGYSPRVVDAVVDARADAAEPIEVRLAKGLTISGHARAESGFAVGRHLTLVSANDADLAAWSEPIGEDGAYTIGGLSPGRYLAYCSREPGSPRNAPFLAARDDRPIALTEASGRAPIDVDLVPAGILVLLPVPKGMTAGQAANGPSPSPGPSGRGRIGSPASAAGAQPRVLRLIVRRPSGAELYDSKWDSRRGGLGQHAVLVAAPGPVVIRVEADDGSSTEQQAEIPTTGTGTANVALP